MTEQEMIELAKQAGWQYAHGDSGFEPLWAFAKLVEEKSYDQGWKDCMDEHLIPRIEFNPKDSV